jgi:hypothetical protein
LELYVKAKAGTLVWDEVKGPLGFTVTPDEHEQRTVELASQHGRFCTDPTLADDDELTKSFGSGLWQHDLSRRQVVPHVANAIMDRLAPV